MKKKLGIILIVVFLALTIGCTKDDTYEKYTYTFTGTFDTAIQVVGYTKNEMEFTKYSKKIQDRMMHLHKLYDKYNNYEGMNNIKTINDNAGIKPVKVDKEIIDLILFSKEMYEKTGKKTNIAFGSVLKIWSQYRDEAESNPANAKIPPLDILNEANKHTEINNVIVDPVNSTVYLVDPKMSLDVGAVAKGYSTEIVAQEVIKDGFTSGIINAGGNVRAFGKPLDNVRAKWGIGIQNPDSILGGNQDINIETVYINDASVVNSGDYQRYYIYENKIIHHLIDPVTLMPGDYFRAVAIVTQNSGLADFMSTTLFLLPIEDGKKLLNSIEGVEALWILKDGTLEATDGMKKIMYSYGATGAITK